MPFYAILRAVPNKLFGVLAMLAALLVLIFLPFLIKIKLVDHALADKSYNVFFYGIVLCYLVLGYLGSMPAETPYVEASQFFTIAYFSMFFAPAIVIMLIKALAWILSKIKYYYQKLKSYY